MTAHGAQGAVVDHAGNLVVACTGDTDVKIYNAGNTTGPADKVLADTPGYAIADAFEDSAGNIYATNLFGPIQSYHQSPGNIVEWAAGSPSGSQPTQTITDPNLAQYYFGDVDAQGNIYVDGLTSFYSQTAEVDEITGGVAKNLGISITFPGGVYVVRPNSASPELSVIDQGIPANLIPPVLSVYKLPFTGTPLYVDNPPENVQKTCDPVAGGYNATGRTIVIGDTNCHSRDRGIVKLNAWRTLSNIDFYYPVDAAFVRSDK